MDAFRIQELMGHKNIVTTQGYVKVSMHSLGEASHNMQESVTKRDQNVTKRDQNKKQNDGKSYA